MQGQLTQLNLEVERLTNDNRQLSDTSAYQIIKATNDLANKNAEIERFSRLLKAAETDRDEFRQTGIVEICNRDNQINVLVQSNNYQAAELDRISGLF